MTTQIVMLLASLFTQPISEEQPAATCGTDKAVTGFDCTGSYCDNVALKCEDVPGTLGASRWTRWFSEEGHPRHDRGICKQDEMMTGVSCKGSYCDNLSLECTKTTARLSQCRWEPKKHSEEQNPYHAASGRVVRGIVCSGSYCDDKQFLTCAAR